MFESGKRELLAPGKYLVCILNLEPTVQDDFDNPGKQVSKALWDFRFQGPGKTKTITDVRKFTPLKWTNKNKTGKWLKMMFPDVTADQYEKVFTDPGLPAKLIGKHFVFNVQITKDEKFGTYEDFVWIEPYEGEAKLMEQAPSAADKFDSPEDDEKDPFSEE